MIGDDFSEAILKALLSVGYHIPNKGILISSGEMKSKVDLLEACKLLGKKGYDLYASHGTCKFLNDNGIEATDVNWPDEEGNNNIQQMIADRRFDLIINIPERCHAARAHQWLHHSPERGRLQCAAYHERPAGERSSPLCTITLDDMQIKSWNEY